MEEGETHDLPKERKVCYLCGKARPPALRAYWRSPTNRIYLCGWCALPGWSERILAKEKKLYGSD